MVKVDGDTGETKAQYKMQYPNWGGTLATAGNLVFNGAIDGVFSALDARTLQPLWSFNAGTGFTAPPVTYSVNGKQYIAVLVGSRQTSQTLAEFPELKTMSVASMLYVFGL